MQIEVGKFYVAADGSKVGPMEHWYDAWRIEGDGKRLWASDGKRYHGDQDNSHLVDEWTEATPAMSASEEITWGEWGPVDTKHEGGSYMFRYIEGQPGQFRYPVQKQPVVETVTMHGHHLIDDKWVFGVKDSEDTARITFETCDGKPDWSTLRGEDLA